MTKKAVWEEWNRDLRERLRETSAELYQLRKHISVATYECHFCESKEQTLGQLAEHLACCAVGPLMAVKHQFRSALLVLRGDQSDYPGIEDDIAQLITRIVTRPGLKKIGEE